MPLIRKPIAEVSETDLAAICADGWIEDEQIDFKREIPHREPPGQDPWTVSRDIKPYGRDQLLSTVVAFANSFGGDLLVGVAEKAGSKPGEAVALSPVPDAADAAHRLGQMAAASIDPPIPGLQVRAVPTGQGTDGVIVLRVPRSRAAPHRVATSKECYQRVRDDSVPMTMRQIQDLTFRAARGLDAVDRRFSALRSTFIDWAGIGKPLQGNTMLALRVTAVPVDDSVLVDRVHGVDEIRPTMRHPTLAVSVGGRPHDLHCPIAVYNWRPMLRGSQAFDTDSGGSSRVQVHADGVVCYETVMRVAASADEVGIRGGSRTHSLPPHWVFALLINAVESADRVRNHAGASAVELAVELEISTSHELPIYRFGRNLYYDVAGTLPAGSNLLPRYVFGAQETWEEPYKLAWRDFWNTIGVDAHGDRFLVDPKA